MHESRNHGHSWLKPIFSFVRAFKIFFMCANGEAPLAGEGELSVTLEECFHALKNSLQVVAIDLEIDDDAQVIFETLNARGEPLLPADLLRNFVFLRAARNNEPVEELYEQHWKRFDDEFWRRPVKQGRLLRPRSDLFIQHFLASRLTYDISDQAPFRGIQILDRTQQTVRFSNYRTSKR